MARLSGYGVVLVPYWPYTFARSGAAPDVVLVTNWREDGPDHPLRAVETEGGRVLSGTDLLRT